MRRLVSLRPRRAKPIAPDETRAENLHAYIELLRSDLRSQKIAIITEVMQFTEDEDTKFWPVYREYETELAKLNDERLALIKDYAANYDDHHRRASPIGSPAARSTSKAGDTRSS